MLEVRDITVDFTGLRAVDEASFAVPEGSIVGLIGPNGAGKTTLFNVVTGMIRPTSGQVLFKGEDLSRLGPASRNRRGIARTFQVVKPFGGLTVLDNVVVGALTSGRSRHEAFDRAHGVIDRLELTPFRDRAARSLPLALRKRLEVARALATDPELVLLDEIMGGLNPSEVNDTLQLIEELQREGLTFLVIEHNMRAIMQIAESVVVLNQGQVLVEGSPEEVTRDQQVIAVYLGEPLESA